jgi:hypothetical protein
MAEFIASLFAIVGCGFFILFADGIIHTDLYQIKKPMIGLKRG